MLVVKDMGFSKRTQTIKIAFTQDDYDECGSNFSMADEIQWIIGKWPLDSKFNGHYDKEATILMKAALDRIKKLDAIAEEQTKEKVSA